MMYFQQFLFVEGTSPCNLDLASILVFVTGLKAIPPMGFSKQLCILIYHGDVTGTCPRSSTCNISLIIPVGLCGYVRLLPY